MNKQTKEIAQNVYYTILANMTTMVISILTTLFVPKMISITDYSYWQLYIFYSSYSGLLQLGWLDGIYLKLGGSEYDELDKKNLGTQFWYLIFFEICISILIGIIFNFVASDPNQELIILFTLIASVISIGRAFIQYILQATNRIREYSRLVKSDRYVYIIAILIYFLLGGRSYIALIMIDIVSRFLLLILSMTTISDIVFNKLLSLKNIIKEIIENCKIGLNLMLANIASQLIIGSIRFFVKDQWSIETFGTLSLSLNISNMFLTFVGAVGIVIFPILRRINNERLKEVYTLARKLFVPLALLILIFYYPGSKLLSLWLPEYKISLNYLGILFPMIFYEGRMSLLVNPYMKSMRMEKKILKVNIVTLVMTLILSLIAVYGFRNLYFTVVVIILSLAFRAIYAELILGKELGLNLVKENIKETLLIVIFIFMNLYFTDGISFIVYFIVLLIYFYTEKDTLLESFNRMKKIIGQKKK